MVAFVSTYDQNTLIGGSTCVGERTEPIEYLDYITLDVDESK